MFSREQLAGNPDFVVALGHLARGLRELYDESPRLSRSMASHQRWLLGQAAVALDMEYDPGNPASGLTAGRLKEFIIRTRSASRNTVLNFLEEMLSYRYAHYAEGESNRRARRLVVAEISLDTMFRWFAANLAALDQLDQGDRLAQLQQQPHVFRLAQPRAARACVEHDGWREPPPRVAMFLWTEAGGLVMDEFIARLDPACNDRDRLAIGRIDTRAMAENFMMSRTHLQRLLAKAAAHGCLGWDGPGKSGDMWISRDFLTEYCGWQAIKFSIIDEAFHWSLQQAEPAPLPYGRAVQAAQ